MLASQMKRFSILEEMERLAQGTVGEAPRSKQFTLNSFFSAQPIQTSPVVIPQTTTTTTTTTYHIFTDGACPNNGRKSAKASYAIVFLGTDESGPPKLEVSKPVSHTEPQTNQRAELSAIYNAAQIVQEHNIWKEADKICFWTDSQYAIKCITEWGPSWQAKGWKKRDGKPIEHLDLLKPLILLKSEKGPKFTLKYVEAHQSALRSTAFPWRWNAKADALAQGIT